MGMGFTKLVSWELEWEWKWLDENGREWKLHFPIYSSRLADHQTLLMDPCFCIVICRWRWVSLWISMRHCLRWHCMCIFWEFDWFFCSSTSVSCIVKFPGHLLSDEILLAVREWELKGMGITSGNGKGNKIKTRWNLGVWMVMGMNHYEREGMGLKKDNPAHL